MSREFSIDVIRTLQAAGHLAYWAGGCVRDLLRGERPSDYDVATDATPEQVRALFGARRTLAVGESFGVIIVLGPPGAQETVEVATFRSEGNYLDGRRPSQITFSSPREDAQRRDFTINGMFFDPLTETVHDYVGGQADLAAGLVRAIGAPRERMEEDKLRLLRAVRFTAALGYRLDQQTASAVADMASQIVVVSAERIAQELRKMLASPQRARAMELCEELRLLRVVIPELQEFTIAVSLDRWQSLLETLRQLGDASFSTALAALLRDVPPSPVSPRRPHAQAEQGTVQAVCRRLKLSNDETQAICWLSGQRGRLADLPTASAAEVKRLVAAPLFGALLQLERAAAAAPGGNRSAIEWVDDYLAGTPWDEIAPAELITGRDLLANGYQSGPRFKAWLRAVRDAQLNGELSTREEALQYVAQLAAGD